MRKVLYGAACSLDGFIAGANDEIDWLHFSKDVQAIMKDSFRDVDTILMGRKTFDFAQKMGGGGSGGMPNMKTYVFSRTLQRIDAKGVELVSSDAGEFVRQLKEQDGKGIVVMGGGDLAGSLFAADVIDEVGLNVHPLILGRGVPFFTDPHKRVQLELVENRTIDGGCVLLTYGVRRS